MQKIFSTFYLKGVQSGFSVSKSFKSFWLGISKFCFEVEIIPRAFHARLNTIGTFFMFIRTREF